jgi:hypothetical protein
MTGRERQAMVERRDGDGAGLMEGKGIAFMGLLMALAWSPPAGAQSGGGTAQRPAAMAPVTGHLALPGETPIQRRSRVSDLREIDAVDPTGQRVVRSLAVSDNAEFGLGILSVSGDTEKRSVGLRTDPRIDVAPGRTRVAGAGFAIRF